MGVTASQKYTLGFIFDKECKHVLLIHKQKPVWQKGKINGVGGKYEARETAEACIRREVREETRLDIPEESWVYVGTIRQEAGDVGFFATCYQGNMADAATNDHEKIEWFYIGKLPDNAIRNLHWLIPLSLEKLRGEFKSFSVEY